MALVLAGTGYLLYATLGHDSLPEQNSPSRLTSEAQTVRTTIDNYTWEQAVADAREEVRIHEPLKTAGSVEIDPDPYQLAGNLDQPVVPPMELHKDPEFLTVTEFEGHGVTGLFAFIDEEGASPRFGSRAHRRRTCPRAAAAE